MFYIHIYVHCHQKTKLMRYNSFANLPIKTRMFACPSCNKRFKSDKGRLSHLTQVHSESPVDKRKRCDIVPTLLEFTNADISNHNQCNNTSDDLSIESNLSHGLKNNGNHDEYNQDRNHNNSHQSL